MSVIASRCGAAIDTCESLLRKAGGAAQKRGVTVTQQIRLDQPAVPMNDSLRGQLARAVEAAGYLVHHLESGAGHDAMIIAPHLPSAMLFSESPGRHQPSPRRKCFSRGCGSGA